MKLFAFAHLTQKSFNPNVLIGNWFEERCDRLVDKRAIVPGIYGNSGCAIEHSVYEDTYQRHTPDNTNFNEYKREAFVNRLNSQDTHFRSKDSDEYLKNMTTSMDIMYNIRLKKARAELESGGKLLDKTEEMLRNYSTETQTGLLNRLNWERLREESSREQSTYRRDYQKKRLVCPKERIMWERCRKYKRKPPFQTEE
ncbi:unnamed protein product, partial [Ceratitis capitata]